MKALWNKQALITAIDGYAIGDIPETFSGISIDSRTLIEGDIFSVSKDIILMVMILRCKLMNEVQLFLLLRKTV